MLHIIEHPLIKVKLTQIRQSKTPSKIFKEVVSEISALMCYEITRNMQIQAIQIETPMQTTTGYQIKENEITLVPILRAGLGMVEGILNLIPTAKVGHIGIYRDHETLEPVEYLCKLPTNIANQKVLVLDPMLATGGSAVKAIQVLKDNGAKTISLACLVGCPEGVKAMQESHPDVEIYLATLDEKLDENGYILPGLGDAGDRLFGTN